MKILRTDFKSIHKIFDYYYRQGGCGFFPFSRTKISQIAIFR